MRVSREGEDLAMRSSPWGGRSQKLGTLQRASSPQLVAETRAPFLWCPSVGMRAGLEQGVWRDPETTSTALPTIKRPGLCA